MAKPAAINGWTRPDTYDDQDNLWPVFKSGQGVYLQTEQGDQFLDAKGMMKCVSLGHGVPEIIAAAHRQMETLAYVPMMDNFQNLQAEQLCQQLLELSKGVFSKAYLSTTGTASVEVALMLALMHHQAKGASDKTFVGSVETGYHGQSLRLKGICAAEEVRRMFHCTQQDSFQIPPAYCHRCPYDKEQSSCSVECAEALDDAIRRIGPDLVAAMFLEPVASERMIIPPARYFQRIREITRKHDVVFVLDEVITGFGRLGTHFAFEYFDIRPDIVCLGKAINNGLLPIAATMVTGEIHHPIADQNLSYEFGSTQDGNPVCCASAMATVAFLQRHDTRSNVKEIGGYLVDALREQTRDNPLVDDVRGVGLFIGVELSPELDQLGRMAVEDQLRRAFIDAKLIVHVEEFFVLITPALNITKDIADEIATRTVSALRSFARSHDR